MAVIEDQASFERDDLSVEAVESAPPDGGYGWVVVAAVFTINCFTWGVVSPYGIYLSYYLRHHEFPGATSIDYAFVGSFNFSAAFVVAPFVTILARDYGTKLTMYCGVLFITAGFICASFSYQKWHLYLSQGVLVGLGVGFIYIPSTALISQWFSAKRSLANGLTAAGAGVGGIIMSLATNKMIENISLEWSLRVTAFVTLGMNCLAIAFIKDRNRLVKPTQNPFDMQLLGNSDVWLLLTWAFISMLGYMTLVYSLPDYALSVGHSQSRASNLLTCLNVGAAVGRPLIGIFSDRLGRIRVAAVLTLVCGLLCFAIWIPPSPFSVDVLFALISGAILGVFFVTIGPVCVEVSGMKRLPSLLSLCWLVIATPSLFAEAIALKLKRPDSTRPYLYPQLFAGSAYVVASLFLIALALHRKLRKSHRWSGQTVRLTLRMTASLSFGENRNAQVST